MRAVIQRVSKAEVTINSELKSAIGKGLLVLCIEKNDTESDIDWLVDKIRQMRIFSDEAGKMNFSIEDVKGQFLIVSQFTLHALIAKGNRPSFIKAARPETAIPLYEKFIERLERTSGLHVGTGTFGADMQVTLINDGPVTLLADSQNKE